LDNGPLGRDVDVLLSDFETKRRVGIAIDHQLNEENSELIVDDMDVVAKNGNVAPTITHINCNDASLLGAPFGNY
jgi:hypothetical protein